MDLRLAIKRAALSALALSVLGCWQLSEKAMAAYDSGISTHPSPSAKTITLFETTGFYDDHLKEIGELSPQTVTIMGTRSVRAGHGEGYRRYYYQIATWLGPMWISPGNAEFDQQVPLVTNIDLGNQQPLYEDPGLTKPMGGELAPQIVTTKAKWGNRYLIETKAGDKWISPVYPSLVGVQEVDEEVEITHVTELMRNPISFGTGASITPQTVKVKEVWMDWHRIDSWIGPVWFRLHELQAADRNDDVEIAFTNRYLDATNNSLTHVEAEVQLGPKWHDRKEAAPVGFQVYFYNAQGERLGESIGVVTELADGMERKAVKFTVDGDVRQFAYATVQVGMLFGKIVNDVQPTAEMSIIDDARPELRLGAIHVRRDGAFSVIQGQFQLDRAGAAEVKGQLIFSNNKGVVLGTVPVHIRTDANFAGKDTIHTFESIASANVKEFKSIQLLVDSIDRK
ncbi:hypothetical protein [Paenibacillus sedimenti]|uniref:Uncharacterized protein n=1 Tax=Paenibacillus sedimenti TaxID=2770274 RepID=A0A926QLD3_9BACL|nr:hypothetical protein [Paenibacillus sedimenti]MBD0382467.1 hypothetical protein [Paenibacillus sedimenti]